MLTQLVVIFLTSFIPQQTHFQLSSEWIYFPCCPSGLGSLATDSEWFMPPNYYMPIYIKKSQATQALGKSDIF